MKHNYNLCLGILISAIVVILLIVGAFWTPYNPDQMNASERLKAPSWEHILGTDNFGRDIFSRLLKGGGSTLWIAALTVFIGLAAGIVIGAFTGYYGGVLDEVIMRLNDVLNSFPSILFSLVVVSLLGPGKKNVVIALGLLFIPSFARITRSEFARIKNLDYVKCAKLQGVPALRIMFVHILPNAINTLLSATAIGFNNAVLAEASLSFLGIGVQPPDASLGRMLSESQTFLFRAPWYTLSVGITIILLILGFGLLSDGLGDIE
jgi:peptide/nickel transport system permease protein